MLIIVFYYVEKTSMKPASRAPSFDDPWRPFISSSTTASGWKVCPFIHAVDCGSLGYFSTIHLLSICV